MTSTRKAFRPPSAWTRVDILAGTLSINVLGLLLPIVMLQVYDRIVPQAALVTFAVLLIALVSVAIVDAVLRIIRSRIMAWLGAGFEHRAAVDAYDSLLDADVLRYEAEASGSYLDRFQSLDQLREFYSGQASVVLVDLPFVVIFLILIYVIAGGLVLVPLGLLIIFGIVNLFTSGRLRDALDERNKMDDRRYNFMIEALGSIHTVKAMAMEPLMQRRYERLQGQSAVGVYRLSSLTGWTQGLAMSFSQIATVVVVSIGCIQVINGNLTIGGLAAASLLTGRTVQPVLRGLALWSQFQGIRLARERIEEIYALPAEAEPGREPVTSVVGRITLEGVRFQYGEDHPELLRGIDLDVEPGEAIGITGANGVGKSTTLSLILGLLKPTQGRILLDGRPIDELDRRSMRAHFGYMPQRTALFQGTLIENMTMFQDGEAVERAIAAVRLLGLDEVITRLPRGLETRLGDTTVETLPDGVRQRIAMVRALVNDPQVILFDNANNTLDQQSDTLVQQLFLRYKGTRTMILVSHRPSLLSICDRCFRLSDGVLNDMAVPKRQPKRSAGSAGPRMVPPGAAGALGAFAMPGRPANVDGPSPSQRDGSGDTAASEVARGGA